MFSTLRTRFGIPGVISVIALVFAMLGGAYAASNSSGGGKATASAKARKGPKGPKGATGPAGPAGPAGPVGPAGAKGDAGANGSNGSAGATGASGATGANGQSVTISSYTGPECHGEGEKGAKFTNSTGTAYACNGGGGGGGGLPVALGPSQSETGTWTLESTSENEAAKAISSVSFPIPLAAADAESIEVKYWEEGGFGQRDPQCTGSTSEPQAEPGFFCLYLAKSTGGPEGLLHNEIQPFVVPPLEPSEAFEPTLGVGTSGAFLYANEFHLPSRIGGTFAVAAPEAP